MSLPEPRPGLVIRYAYLWHSEYRRGKEEGVKDRPCVVVLSAVQEQGELVVTVAPITHSPPHPTDEAVEIPITTKQRLGLDSERSWIVVTEVNRFVWPGPDLRPIGPSRPGEVAYGYLPPKLFNQAKTALINTAKRLKTIPRTE